MVIKAAKKFDDESNTTVPTTTTTLKKIIPCLWTAHYKKIEKIDISPILKVIVSQQLKELHIFHLKNHINTPKKSPTVDLSQTVIFDQMNTQLEQLGSRVIMNQSI